MISKAMAFSVGLLTSLLTAYILAWMELNWNFSIYSFGLWFVIPVGAALCGAIAGIGFAIGFWMTQAKLSAGMVWAILANAVLAFVAMRYFVFLSVGGNGDAGTFIHYLNETTQNYRITVGHHASFATSGALGVWGYAISGIQILGFGVGSLFTTVFQAGGPYCDACHRYMKTKESLTRFGEDGNASIQAAQSINEKLKAEAYSEALKEAREFGAPTAGRKAQVRCHMVLCDCPACGSSNITFHTEFRESGKWKTIEASKFEKRVQQI